MRVDRRDFMKAAVAIGGVSALSAVEARAETSPPQGTDDPSTLPNRQFAWDDYVGTSDIGLPKFPEHHVMLHLDYCCKTEPRDSHRRKVGDALSTLERAFEWSSDGLLFTLSYSPAYFDRFEADVPADVGLADPQETIDEVDIEHSSDATAGEADAHFHMASDNAQVLLEAEAALYNNIDEVNGVEVEGGFNGILKRADRRTGFIGAPKPHERWDEDVGGENPIPETAPVFFGFKSLFTDSQPTEDDVVIDDPDHPFHDGTTEHVSLLRDDRVRDWHANFDHEERVDRMFTPHHDSEDTGEHGHGLGSTSGTDEMTMDQIAVLTEEDAELRGVVGHAQKLARARDPGPQLLRRDFPSTDEGEPHTQFISLQRTIDDFVDVRKHMSFVYPDSGNSADSELDLEDHGILEFILTQHRANFLIPPRELRTLPPADP
jgi:hypothetical protein